MTTNNKTATYPNLSVRINKMVTSSDTNVKAIASLSIGNAFALHGIKVIDSSKGLFVSMPKNKYTYNGETKYEDIFHPITADARNMLNEAVLKAYSNKLEEDMNNVFNNSADMSPTL